MLKENLILNQIIKNVYFREKVFSFLQPSFFEEQQHKKLYSIIRGLFEEKVVVLDRSTLLLSFNDEVFIDDILEIEFSNENIDYLINETESWAKSQALKNAIMASADIIVENKDIDSIDGLIQEALAVSFDKDLGLDYLGNPEERFEKYDTDEKVYPTGYKMLDFYTNGGLRSKTLTVIMGASNLGKTLNLCNLSCNLSAAGYNGIYLTLELDEDIIGRRCDAINTQIPYFMLLQRKAQAIKFLKEFKGGNLFIKQYLPSRASCINIRTYLKELELYKKFKADFIVVDYLGLMRPNGSKHSDNMYEYYLRVTEQLRELAIEFDVPILTAVQVGREAYGSATVGMENVRGSMGIIETADLVIALTQTDAQEEDNLITWKFVKNRLGRRNGNMETQFDSETLKTVEIITSEDAEILNSNSSGGAPVSENIQEETEDVLNTILNDTAETNFDSFS